jgi:hypothetical protein
MSAPCRSTRVQAITGISKRAIWRAKVVKSEPTQIVILSIRTLAVGQRITYAFVSDLERAHVDRIPPGDTLRSAVIWRIEKDCLHLTRT